jgi:hypothetical protein
MRVMTQLLVGLASPRVGEFGRLMDLHGSRGRSPHQPVKGGWE